MSFATGGRGRARWAREGGAVSGAVTAIMLLLIISSVLSLIIGVYVPVWGEQDESQHMRVTLEQFYSLRENIDSQVLRQTPMTASSKITLGNEPSALLGFSQTSGRLVSNPFNGTLRVYNTTDETDVYAMSRGNITFTSQNSYVPQQSYIYEQGAVLVAGSGEAAMRAPPHFSVTKGSAGNLSVSVLFISLAGDFYSFSGTENIVLETRLLAEDRNEYEGGDWDLGKDLSLNLSTPHAGAWHRYFNDTLQRPLTNLTHGTDYSIAQGNDWVRLDLKAVRSIDLAVAIIEVRVK